MSGSWSNRSLPEPVRDTFTRLLATAERGRLAHAYVISGAGTEWGVLLGQLLLAWLYCEGEDKPCGECRTCRLVETRTHADISWLEPEMKSRVIGIDAMRETIQRLRQTSFEGGWKAAVLWHADRMNESAANAFLKTLEEPPERSIMLLLTERPQSLLPTIMSRCQHIALGGGEAGTAVRTRVEEAMLAWLRKRGAGTTALEQSAWISALLREVREAAERVEKERAGDDVEEDVLNARVQSRVVSARQEVLRTIVQWERDVLACSAGAGSGELHYPAEIEVMTRQGRQRSLAAGLQRIDQIERARRLLEGNLPEAAVWEAILPT